jgi:hypothetical protein
MQHNACLRCVSTRSATGKASYLLLLSSSSSRSGQPSRKSPDRVPLVLCMHESRLARHRRKGGSGPPEREITRPPRQGRAGSDRPAVRWNVVSTVDRLGHMHLLHPPRRNFGDLYQDSRDLYGRGLHVSRRAAQLCGRWKLARPRG